MEWLPRSFDSIASQTYPNFDVSVIDDASTEPGQWEWTQRWCQKRGWRLARNQENLGTLGGLIRATQLANPAEEEVIVHIDGDDWLAGDGVLTTLAQVYAAGDVDLTYGQFSLASTGQSGFCRPYDQGVVERGQYRNAPVSWAPLRTFKAFLWKAIDERDLRGPCGSYFRYATDHAYMNPMLEMAGGRYRAIEDLLYIYNDLNPQSDSRHRPDLHLFTRYYIRNLPKYEPLVR